MKRLAWLITLPVALAVIAFAIANWSKVLVSFDPFSRASPAIAFEAPLFLVLFAVFLVGIVVGGTASFLTRMQNNMRRASRQRQGIKTAKQPDPLEGVPAIAASTTPPSGMLHAAPSLSPPRT